MMTQPEISPHAMNSPKKANWLVRFGAHEWVRHTYERPADDPIRLLGSVRRGPQIGALGITADKKYVQVVGDYVVPLNQGQIKQAISKYKAFEARLAAATAPPPVVVVKRRRVPVMA
jgi:hypothetical protein